MTTAECEHNWVPVTDWMEQPSSEDWTRVLVKEVIGHLCPKCHKVRARHWLISEARWLTEAEVAERRAK